MLREALVPMRDSGHTYIGGASVLPDLLTCFILVEDLQLPHQHCHTGKSQKTGELLLVRILATMEH